MIDRRRKKEFYKDRTRRHVCRLVTNKQTNKQKKRKKNRFGLYVHSSMLGDGSKEFASFGFLLSEEMGMEIRNFKAMLKIFYVKCVQLI